MDGWDRDAITRLFAIGLETGHLQPSHNHWLISSVYYHVKTMNDLDELALFKYPILKYKAQDLDSKKQYSATYVMMENLKSKANQFWTTQDQLLLEEYQQKAQNQSL